MSAGRMRSLALIGAALASSLCLVGVYLAAGGASYAPAQAQDPCEPREWRDPGSLQEIAEQFSLSALDGAACELGVTREALARALATPEARERFSRRFGIGDARFEAAVRAGLLRAIDDAERAGALNPILAAPARELARQVPLDDAIALIQDAAPLFDTAQGLFDIFGAGAGLSGLLDQAQGLLLEPGR